MAGIPSSEIALPTFKNALTVLGNILQKAIDHANSTGVNPDSYAEAALCEDMKPLAFQVQVATNTAKKSVWRLTGVEQESWADDEKTMAELQARVKKALELIAKAPAEKITEDGSSIVNLEMGSQGSMTLPAKTYMLNYAFPNLYFHVTTAYGILRSRGVPLGKSDLLGPYLRPSA